MKRFMFVFTMVLTLGFPAIVFANSPPVVSNVTAGQRTDGSGIVDIYYTLSDADNDRCTVNIEVSDDGGSSWDVTATALSGDIGENISPGRRHITWDSRTDLPGEYGTNYRVKITADDGAGPGGMVWVSISEAGFTGYMSKYETTNAQYCQFLNEALVSGDIKIQSGEVYGNSGPYNGKIYYDMDDSYAQISYSGGSFYVESRDGYSMANHPVVEVSWYGATAFADYYGWRLPTEREWQAVADFDGSYTYGCGTTINQSKANYDYANPLGLSRWPCTSPVGYYPAYGYGMCDMAGNAWEWTDSIYSGSFRVIRGGSWNRRGLSCEVSFRGYSRYPISTGNHLGFRVCR